MKRLIIAGLILLSILIGVPLVGCASSSDCSDWEAQVADLTRENDGLRTELNSAEAGLDSMQSELDAAKADYETIEAERDALESDQKTISDELETIREDYQALIEDLAASDLRNPTWQELKRFLEEDSTDTITYVADKFDCEGFAIKLRDNAARRGFKSAFVALGFGEETAGHALNAFETTDRGLVYVDSTEHDSIGYVGMGKVYGTIALDGVREKYINCDMNPEEFWRQPLAYTQYTGNPFAYGYYQNYTSRREFYEASVDAYNAEVSRYNKAVIAYNQGDRTYSHSEVEAWSDRLESWSANLGKLDEDLGSVRISPMGTVRSIETYWN